MKNISRRFGVITMPTCSRSPAWTICAELLSPRRRSKKGVRLVVLSTDGARGNAATKTSALGRGDWRRDSVIWDCRRMQARPGWTTTCQTGLATLEDIFEDR